MRSMSLGLIGMFLISLSLFAEPEVVSPKNPGINQGQVMGPGAGMGSGRNGGYRTQDGRGMQGKTGRRDPGMQQMLQMLNLDEKQKELLQTINKEHRRDLYRLKSTERDLNFELSELLTEKEFDEGKVNSYIEKLSENNNKTLKIRIDLVKKIRSVLRKDQIEKMNFQLLWNMHGGPKMGGPRDMRGLDQ